MGQNSPLPACIAKRNQEIFIDNQWKPEWLVLQDSSNWGSGDSIFLWGEDIHPKDRGWGRFAGKTPEWGIA